jgi:hypothetical protein
VREIVDYSDQLEHNSQIFLSKAKAYFSAKQKYCQRLFAWESALRCALLEDDIFFTQVPPRSRLVLRSLSLSPSLSPSLPSSRLDEGL